MRRQITNLKRIVLISLLISVSTAVVALDFLEDGLKVLESAIKNKDAFSDIDEPQEIDLGKGMSAQLLGAAPLLDDKELQTYVNQIGMWLVAQTDRSNLPWRFGVLDDDDINAFAAPGGYIFISKGLFMLFRNEAELAGVLAHEIGHVVDKHHLEDIQDKARNGFLKDMGGLVIDDVAGSGWNSVVKELVNSGVDVWESGLNRDDEFEADEMGVVIAARAGYDPYGLLGVLDTLSRINPAEGNSYKLMHATHPAANDRIFRLDTKMTGKMENYIGGSISSVKLYQFQNQLEYPKG